MSIELFEQYGLTLSQQQEEMLEKYADLLVEWNQKFNLTAITQRDEIYLKHFLDCLLLAKKLKKDISLVDVGSGAGFPGIVIKIYRPDIKVTLLEPNNKKITFLKEVISQLDLKDIEVYDDRAEDFSKDHYQQYDVVTARAVAALNILCELCLPLVKVNGLFIAMKGPKALEELDQAKNAIKTLSAEYISKDEFALDESTRIFLNIKKIGNTNKKYPRNYGQIKKRPL